MAESQEDIDSLLAEVNALADEAVADIVGEQGELPDDDTASAAPPDSSNAPISTPPVSSQPKPPSHKPQAPSASPPDAPRENLSRILKLEVPVIVQLAKNTMPLSEIMTLSTGAIIEFDKPSDADLDLMINNKCIGQGMAVKVGENFGLRVTNMGSLRDRIQALGNG